jgi:hypothetical protein
LGWAPHAGPSGSGAHGDGVCGATNAAPLGSCSGARRWAWAQRWCAAVGARLCRAAELASGVGQASGCNYDYAPVWSSDSCNPAAADAAADAAPRGYWASGVAAKGVVAACVAATDDVYVRCVSSAGVG